ncbi:MAG: response regulator transcription factor [Chloroflexi bacterium]|nr:response regulator transcription factor [Chloroflexota bacterium]
MASSQVKLLIVDDHKVVRLGLATLFATVPHCSVVGEADSAAQAVAEADRCRPDVVILDVRLPDGSGVEACREIRSQRPETRVIMLTSYADEDAVIASILAGAAGYVLKQSNPERLVEAVRIATAGGSLLDPAITRPVLEWLRHLGSPATRTSVAGLAEQERRILPLIAEGKTNREIAAVLSLSEHTVKTYVSNILRKLHLARRTEVAALITRYRK